MTKRKNKGKGLRSANGRHGNSQVRRAPKRKVPNPVERVRDDATPTPMMYFCEVELGAPREGALLLVKLTDGTFRFGMCLKGRFANYEHHAEEFVSFAHADRITHWMEVIDPSPFVAKAEAETAQPEGSEAPDSIDVAIHTAAAAAQGYDSPDHQTDETMDVYL